MKTVQGGSTLAAVKQDDSIRWHKCLGHPSFGSLSPLSSLCEFKLNRDLSYCCDICHRVKQTRSSFPLSDSRADRPFGLIHCDLWGYYRTPSYSGCHYFLCIVDDFSRAVWVFLLQDKTETCERLIEFCSMVKNQFGLCVQRVRSDNGTEF